VLFLTALLRQSGEMKPLRQGEEMILEGLETVLAIVAGWTLTALIIYTLTVL